MSYDFDGTNDWIGNTTTCPVTSGPCSVACWFWPDSLGHIINITNSTGADNFRLSVITGNKLRLNAVDNGVGDTIDTAGSVSTSDWNFGGFRITSSTSRKLYLFSSPSYTIETVTDTSSQNPTGFTRLHIGSRRNNSTTDEYYNGKIAEVAIWNVSLEDSDFISMSKGICYTLVRPQNLVFYAPLIRDIVDLTTSKLTLTNNGGATVANHPRIYI
jgi:hypothetical protein